MAKKKNSVLGYCLPEPHITGRAITLFILYLIIPILCIGALGDLFIQWAFGYCTGLWCLASST